MIFEGTIAHQPSVPGREPHAEDEASFRTVRVLVSPRPLDQHRKAGPVVHVLHYTASMMGKLLLQGDEEIFELFASASCS